MRQDARSHKKRRQGVWCRVAFYDFFRQMIYLFHTFTLQPIQSEIYLYVAFFNLILIPANPYSRPAQVR